MNYWLGTLIKWRETGYVNKLIGTGKLSVITVYFLALIIYFNQILDYF